MSSDHSNWSKWITLTETGEGGSVFKVLFENGVHIADFVKDVDGYYIIYLTGLGGWDSFTFRLMADALDELNQPWDDELTAYFEAEKRAGEEPPLIGWLHN